MKKKYILLLVLPILSFGQTQTENYVKTTTYKVSTITTPNPTAVQKVVNVSYFDGLGRPIQQVAHGQSATGKDIVTPITYDAFGRQDKEYLPYVPTTAASLDYKSSALTEVGTFYNSAAYDNTLNPYSQKLFEASPLNRVLKQAAPGNDWKLGSNHEIRLEYQTNIINEVRLYKATATWNATTALYDIALVNATGTVFYPANELYKTITKDENWVSGNNNTTEEFKDKEGRVVLKRTYGLSVVNGVEVNVSHDTYYVYDQFGNLTYVIPPKAPTSITAAILNDLCYQYKYDYRNRLVEKKLPGKQWEFMVYDKLDRVVATGPALSPFSNLTGNGWMLSKYDAFNRVVYTAWWPSTTVTSAGRKTLQTSYSATAAVVNETKIATNTNTTVNGVAFRYTNVAYPNVTTFHVLTVNYYDDYNFPNVATLPTTVETQTVAYNATVKPKGLPTGGWVRALETSTLYKGETNTVVYDYKARPLRQFTRNYLGGYTQVDTRYDFVKTLYTVTRHKRLSTDTELMTKDEFTYTNQDRLLTHTHQINALPKQLLVKNDYDELGELITKKVGGTDVTGVTALQKIDYRYNIRGWMTGINDVENLIQGTDPQDLFAFKINYNTVQGGVPGVGALYNGNIAETYWRTASDDIKRKYGYKYDNLNRLKEAIYQKPDALNPTPNSYNETLTYDKNGNIMSLLRNGDLDDPSTVFQIDNLSYFYPANSNRLSKVTDLSNKPSGFKDGTNTTDDYVYDANGNMVKDLNKGIGTSTVNGITYNHLNLPTKIIFNNDVNTRIEYLYNAVGQKVQKKVFQYCSTCQGGLTSTQTDYLSGFQYTTTGTVVKLSFFPHAEGYVNNTVVNGANVYNYVFNYTDHLGNTRLSYAKDPVTNVLKIIEENHYYPFGLKHTNYNSDYNMFQKAETNAVVLKKPIVQTRLDYQYRYNSKEYQDELGLNLYAYGYRHYDPAIARWTTMDPLLNDLKFSFDDNDVDEDDEDEVYEALVTKLETGDGIFNTDNLNPYGYGYNNPISFDDPDGRCPVCIYVVAALLYSEFANAPTGNAKQDAQNYNDAKPLRTIASETVLKRGGNLLNGTAGKPPGSSSGISPSKSKKTEKTYQTYTKKNEKTGETYSGRTSGKGTPKENVAKRDANHHKNKEGFGPAKLDKSSKNKDAIRGREQKLIKKSGGAKSEGGTSGNSINGVSPKNPKAKKYDAAAKKEFGN